VPADDAALADLCSFAAIETASCDLEPWAAVIGELHLGGELSREEATWLLTLYNTYDDLGSAWSVFTRWPSPRAWTLDEDRGGAADYPCTQERRNLRGGLVLRRLYGYAQELSGGPQLPWIEHPLVGDTPERDFVRLTAHLRRIWGVGRQAAFEWAEFLGKCVGVPVSAGDAQLWESEGPRRSLQRLYGIPKPTQRELDHIAADCHARITASGVELAVWDFETVICDFNVMRDGRYYPGRHLAALREEIDGMNGDRPVMDRAWWRVVPEPWAGIAPGISKAQMPVYRDTGRMVDHP